MGSPASGLPAPAEFHGEHDGEEEGNLRKKKAPPPVADINVTPMVDVMLVLLIIFMVITPMLSKGVSVDLVKTKNPIAMQAADKSDAIVCRDHARWQDLPQYHADWRRKISPTR